MDITAIIVALVAAFLGGGGVFLWKAQSHKTEAEADKAEADGASIIAATALNIAKHWEAQSLRMESRIERLEAENCTLREQVTGLGNRVASLETENQSLRAGVRRLQSQVVGLGGRPVWAPSES